MITVYTRQGENIIASLLPLGQTPPPNAIWLDLFEPDENERVFISTALDIDLPNHAEMQEIESSSRLYSQNGTLYLTTDVLAGAETPNPTLDVLLIALTPQCLVTARYTELHSVQLFASRLKLQPELFKTIEDGVLALLDAITDRTADILEVLGKRVDRLSQDIFHAAEATKTNKAISKERRKEARQKERRLQDILQGIGRAGDTTHKIRDCVSGMIRLVTFLGSQFVPRLNSDQTKKFHAVDRDLRSLSEHAQFVAHETTFLLEATLGQINIEQNNIIKIFSIMAVIFLPPTLFASIWGMNFHHMPELDSPTGYYFALGIMLISALIPIVYFKHRGWL